MSTFLRHAALIAICLVAATAIQNSSLVGRAGFDGVSAGVPLVYEDIIFGGWEPYYSLPTLAFNVIVTAAGMYGAGLVLSTLFQWERSELRRRLKEARQVAH